MVKDCTKLLDQQLLQHLPIVDLSKFSVEAERLGGLNWDSVHQVGDNLTHGTTTYEPQLERMMTKSNSVQLQLKLTYGFM